MEYTLHFALFRIEITCPGVESHWCGVKFLPSLRSVKCEIAYRKNHKVDHVVHSGYQYYYIKYLFNADNYIEILKKKTSDYDRVSVDREVVEKCLVLSGEYTRFSIFPAKHSQALCNY